VLLREHSVWNVTRYVVRNSKLTRQDVFIDNTVKCIPLENGRIRAPTD